MWSYLDFNPTDFDMLLLGRVHSLPMYSLRFAAGSQVLGEDVLGLQPGSKPALYQPQSPSKEPSTSSKGPPIIGGWLSRLTAVRTRKW